MKFVAGPDRLVRAATSCYQADWPCLGLRRSLVDVVRPVHRVVFQ